MSNDATTGADHTPPAPMAPENLAEASRQLLEQSFNDGKFELADQLIAADAVNHDPAEPAELRALRGPEVLKRTVSLYRTAFPDVRITVFNQSARQISVDGEGNSAALAYQFADKVKKNPDLQAFQFELGSPRILPNDHAQFRLEGKPK